MIQSSFKSFILTKAKTSTLQSSKVKKTCEWYKSIQIMQYSFSIILISFWKMIGSFPRERVAPKRDVADLIWQEMLWTHLKSIRRGASHVTLGRVDGVARYQGMITNMNPIEFVTQFAVQHVQGSSKVMLSEMVLKSPYKSKHTVVILCKANKTMLYKTASSLYAQTFNLQELHQLHQTGTAWSLVLCCA